MAEWLTTRYKPSPDLYNSHTPACGELTGGKNGNLSLACIVMLSVKENVSLIESEKGMRSMAQCEVCGNQYDKTFEVLLTGRTHVFDSFECAITALAPTCKHCGCKIIGHGVEANGAFYCCAHCANAAGVQGVQDRR